MEEIEKFEENNPNWAVNVIAMKADSKDEEMTSTRRKRKRNKISAKDFIQQETQENNTEEGNKEKGCKIEIFPYR